MFQKIINPEEGNANKAPHVPNRPQAPQPTHNPAPAPPQVAAAAPQPQQPVAQAPASGGGHRNRLSSDVEIKGTIRFQDELLVDGKVEGEISSTGTLAIQENARIRAEVKVGSVVIQGKVHGNITATQTVELRAGSEVVGDIKAAILTMEAGAIFVGKSEVGAPSSQPAKSADTSSNKGSASENKANQNNQQKAPAKA
ncbi:bactofilin family protein [Roseibacillus ishigakijimensis]|uniref:Polymer-forming cytoskeletal protein n=1 Tax=Roseibacillus ishigakijimensis TaxID=454146 RepID=A0A934VM44_9BACT|nr:polymer-forming cytoskeletal protein [Roseibacillus ishigakijimensis]MBK1833716.1 polymer-forming cytoskeletal protein [Roseibacillus ishigakijimensis]